MFACLCCDMVFYDSATCQSLIEKFRGKNQTVGFVPTMGALHQWHLSLVRRSLIENDLTVISIFVNPTQFNSEDDLNNYPRNPDADIRLLQSLLTKGEEDQETSPMAIFLPNVSEIYSDQVRSDPYDFGMLSSVMEGANRPGHFNGVATIVSWFFEIIQPDRAYFGEKDYQQLLIIRYLVRQKDYPIIIVPVSIKREPHGLAMSSRNRRLSAEGFIEAGFIFKTLLYGQLWRKDLSPKEVILKVQKAFDDNKHFKLEYFCIADAETLQPLTDKFTSAPARAFIVAHIEGVRLIDNLLLNP